MDEALIILVKSGYLNSTYVYKKIVMYIIHNLFWLEFAISVESPFLSTNIFHIYFYTGNVHTQ